ncbi:YuzF family protein [Pseudalkalibacillus caeni]|uniref:DUF2642 domain-containing protein n=1 Tax=Exobacillus caeni TaxID=2574798 RepID=A0A5R9F2U7_9BACL|nr:YuzF family protein [Pseudalkalibacillus caeni]TLS36819.1 DUF2642 domain-containing protein [Pseudalkalibacillus caeni]
MSYNNRPVANQYQTTPSMVSMVDPYFYQTLLNVMGQKIIVDTTRGNVKGIVKNVLPDHVVLDSEGTLFFVRIQQIVWIMPE